MKNIFVSMIFCALFSGFVFSQTDQKKTELFTLIKTLRLQYRTQGYYLNNVISYGERAKHKAEFANWAQTKVKIDSLDKEYTRLLTESELKEYKTWKSNEDMKDKTTDLGWWYNTFMWQGC
jgi:hypothetical protein